MNVMPTNSIELLPTVDLVEELHRRHAISLLVLSPHRDSDRYSIQLHIDDDFLDRNNMPAPNAQTLVNTLKAVTLVAERNAALEDK